MAARATGAPGGRERVWAGGKDMCAEMSRSASESNLRHCVIAGPSPRLPHAPSRAPYGQRRPLPHLPRTCSGGKQQRHPRRCAARATNKPPPCSAGRLLRGCRCREESLSGGPRRGGGRPRRGGGISSQFGADAAPSASSASAANARSAAPEALAPAAPGPAFAPEGAGSDGDGDGGDPMSGAARPSAPPASMARVCVSPLLEVLSSTSASAEYWQRDVRWFVVSSLLQCSA